MKKLVLISTISTALIFGCASEKSDFSKAEKENSIEAYESFLKNHSQGEYSQEAKDRIHGLAFQLAKGKDSLHAYREFKQKYPQNRFSEDVNNRIEELGYQLAEEKDSLHVYREFKQNYPKSRFLAKVDGRIEELVYQLTIQKNNKEAYQSFLKEYPNSKYAGKVKELIQEPPVFEMLSTKSVVEVNSSMLRQTWAPVDTLKTKGLILLLKAELTPKHVINPSDDFIVTFATEGQGQASRASCDGLFQSSSINTFGDWVFFGGGMSLKIHVNEPTTIYLNLLFDIPVKVSSISVLYKTQPIANSFAIK